MHRNQGRPILQRLGVAYTAGAFGALVNSLVVWASGSAGITAALGVSLAPALTPGWLYARLVWGGLWGAVFLLPVLTQRPWWCRGLLFSLGPTLVTLLVVLPLKAGNGLFGLDLGPATPLLVLVYNAVWGLTAAVAIAAAERPDATQTRRPFVSE